MTDKWADKSRLPLADKPHRGYDDPRTGSQIWLVNIYFWRDGDHWGKYAHLPFPTRIEAQAYIDSRDGFYDG